MRIKGTVRGVGQNYADGVERQEIWFEGAARTQVPMRGGRSRDILITLPYGEFWGTIRRTPNCNYAWISGALRTAGGEKIRLCSALEISGFRKNSSIVLDVKEHADGFLLGNCGGEAVIDAERLSTSVSRDGTNAEPQLASESESSTKSQQIMSRSGTVGTDVARLEQGVRKLLEEGLPALGDEYFYAHLPLCVIDAVFSVGIRYSTVENLVSHYARHYGLTKTRADRNSLPPVGEQQALDTLVAEWKGLGAERLANEVFVNRCKTSPRGGVLKAEAVGRYAETLCKCGIATLQDAAERLPDPAIERQLMQIPGQGSGISTSYFLMLSGSSNFLKPDRWLCRFVSRMVDRTVSPVECDALIRTAFENVREDFPRLTLRELDYAIWAKEKSN